MNLPTDWCRSCFRETGLRTGGWGGGWRGRGLACLTSSYGIFRTGSRGGGGGRDGGGGGVGI